MNYNDDTFYIEFYINGVIKVDSEHKKEKIKKIQNLLNKIINDQALELVKSSSDLTVMSESELLQTLISEVDDFN